MLKIIILCSCIFAYFASSHSFAAQFSDTVALDIKSAIYRIPWKRPASWRQHDWTQFNTLADYSAPNNLSAPLAFPNITTDPEKGRQLVLSRKNGGTCVACHIVPGAKLAGNVGNDLSMLGENGYSDEYLFNYIYDARRFNPNTLMPPWGAHGLLSLEDIAHIVAYLKTLNKSNQFNNPLDDPSQRPIRQNKTLDAFENPALFYVTKGEALFKQKSKSGKACFDCHQTPKETFKSWAAQMPKYAPSMKKFLGVEEFVARHALATTDENYYFHSYKNLALTSYLRHLAHGSEMSVNIDDEITKKTFEKGKQLIQQKIGQLNFSCADCHQASAKRWIRGQYLLPLSNVLNHFPVYRTSRGEIWDIRKRIQWCNVSIRSNPLPPDAPEYDAIELYLAIINQGKRLDAPSMRH